MIDVVLNAAKIAVSEDARKSASVLMELIRRTPDWQKDFINLKAEIAHEISEQAYLLGELTVQKMKKLEFSKSSVGAFRASHTELVANAFQHGCGLNQKARIGLVIEITPHYTALTVANPKGKKFDLQKCLQEQRSVLAKDLLSRTGRGLLVVNELADTLTQTPDGEGVKAVFYNPAVSLRLSKLEDLLIIEIRDGVLNPSMNRRITALARKYPGSNLIIDFYKFRVNPESDDLAPTDTLRGYIDLQKELGQTGKKVVVLLNPKPDVDLITWQLLPDEMIAHSWDEALAKVNKKKLSQKIKRRKKT